MASCTNMLGYGSATITADGGTIIGLSSKVSGVNGFASGQSCVVTGRNALAGGEDTCAWGYRSCALGQFTQAFGQGSFSVGNLGVASGDNSAVFGQYGIASRPCQFTLCSSSIKGNGDSQTSVLHLVGSGAFTAMAACDLKMAGAASFNNYLEDGKVYSVRAVCTVAATVAGARKACTLQCHALLSYDFYGHTTNVVSQTGAFVRGDMVLSAYTLAFTAGGLLQFGGLNTAAVVNASCRVEFEEVTYPDWTPLELRGHGLSLWLKSDVAVSVSAGQVTGWGDLSGAVGTPDSWSHTPNNMVSASGPTLLTDQVNGYPCLRFNGVDQYLEADPANTHPTLANVLASTLGGNAGYTVFVVAKVPTVATNCDDPRQNAGLLADSNEKFGIAVRAIDIANVAALQGWNDDGTIRVVRCNWAGGAGDHKFVACYASNTRAAHIVCGAVGNQGVVEGHLEQAGNPSSLTGLLQIGRSGAGGKHAQMDLFEVVICSRRLTQGEVQNVLGYLGNKYTLPL